MMGLSRISVAGPTRLSKTYRIIKSIFLTSFLSRASLSASLSAKRLSGSRLTASTVVCVTSLMSGAVVSAFMILDSVMIEDV